MASLLRSMCSALTHSAPPHLSFKTAAHEETRVCMLYKTRNFISACRTLCSRRVTQVEQRDKQEETKMQRSYKLHNLTNWSEIEGGGGDHINVLLNNGRHLCCCQQELNVHHDAHRLEQDIMFGGPAGLLHHVGAAVRPPPP